MPNSEFEVTDTSNEKPWKVSFGLLWASQSVSMIGSSLVQFALIWWITEKTGSAVSLSTATIMFLLPGVILGPFIGALVDRWNRKLTMIYADIFTALGALALFFLYYTNTLQLWHVYLILFLRSLTGTFQWPAMQSSLSLLVPEKHLSRVAGLNMAVRGATNIISPPLGALLVSWQPMHNVMLVDIISAVLAVSMMAMATIKETKTAQALMPATVKTLWFDVKAAARFIFQWKGLRMLILFAVVLNILATPAFSLFPLLVTSHYNGGVWHLSTGQTVAGIGFLVGGLLFSVWGGFRKKIHTMFAALALMGSGSLIMGLSPMNAFWLGMVGMFLIDFANPFSSGSFLAIVQARVPVEIQGRVFTMSEASMQAFAPLALLAAGPLADIYGVPIWYLIFGVGTIMLAVIGLMNRDITNIESQVQTISSDVSATQLDQSIS